MHVHYAYYSYTVLVLMEQSSTSFWEASIRTWTFSGVANYMNQVDIKSRMQASETAVDDLMHETSYDRLQIYPWPMFGSHVSARFIPGTIYRMLTVRYTGEKLPIYCGMDILCPVKLSAAHRTYLRSGWGSRLPAREDIPKRHAI